MTKRLVILSISAFACLASSRVLAHVKWFAPYDVSEHPISLVSMPSTILPPVALVALAFWIACHVERTRLGPAFLGVCRKITAGLESRIDDLFRGSAAVFFSALAFDGSVILTPELKTSAGWVALVQAAIAIFMFWRATLPIAALGIVALLAYAIASYGFFHMMDYPVFLGITVFLVLSASRNPRILAQRMTFARCGLSLSLMWAAVEKWAYPQWTWYILKAHPHLGMGVDLELLVAFAGAVELGLGFALLWTPAIRKGAALLLAAMMAAAIIEFGAVDAIGHLLLIVILVSIVAEEVPDTTATCEATRPSCAGPAAQLLTLVLLVGAYYGAHSAIQGPNAGHDAQIASPAAAPVGLNEKRFASSDD